MRVICTRLLSACRKPLEFSGWSPRTITQRCPRSLGGVRNFNTGDRFSEKVDPEINGLHSSNIFLKPQVVLYDGVCHLCNAGVNWVIKVDKEKKISFCAVQSEVAKPYLLLCGLTKEDVLKRFLFVEGPGQYSQASTAALRVALYLPFPYPILGALFVIPAPFRDAVYDYVAKHRYKWFGQAVSCILPKDDVIDRFIDRAEILSKYRQDG